MADTKQSGGLLQSFGEWWSQPFNSKGSAFNWVLFVGLVIIAAFLWQLMLLKINQEI